MKIVVFDGRGHLVCPSGGAEHTLCGVASDAADSERDESLRWKTVPGSKISCDTCITIIKTCVRARTMIEPGKEV